MGSYIGLKLANGLFYPILAEGGAQKKRLVLTTVMDNQAGVQIDLYRAPDKSMKAARYIGTLVVEDILPKKKGEPSIEMIIEYVLPGDILAQAVDLDCGGERQQLSVSLKALSSSAEAYDMPEDGLRGVETRTGRPFPARILLAAAVALIVLGAGFAVYTFLGSGAFLGGKADSQAASSAALPAPPPEPPPPVFEAPPPPPPPVAPPPRQDEQAEAEAIPPEPAPPPESPPAPPPRAARVRPLPPVASYNIPSPIPPQGVWYTVRWGDTLWAISEAFYRDPWRYRFLARSNNIYDPSYIIAGERIKIPPRP